MWYALVQEEELGPMPFEEVLDLYYKDIISADTYIWVEGMPEWVPISQMSDFSELLFQGSALPENSEFERGDEEKSLHINTEALLKAEQSVQSTPPSEEILELDDFDLEEIPDPPSTRPRFAPEAMSLQHSPVPSSLHAPVASTSHPEYSEFADSIDEKPSNSFGRRIISMLFLMIFGMGAWIGFHPENRGQVLSLLFPSSSEPISSPTPRPTALNYPSTPSVTTPTRPIDSAVRLGDMSISTEGKDQGLSPSHLSPIPREDPDRAVEKREEITKRETSRKKQITQRRKQRSKRARINRRRAAQKREQRKDAKKASESTPPKVVRSHLTRSDIARAQQRKKKTILRCLKQDPKLKGMVVTVQIKIEPTGKVSKTKADSVRLRRSPAKRCIEDAIKKIEFPPFRNDPMSVPLPVKF